MSKTQKVDILVLSTWSRCMQELKAPFSLISHVSRSFWTRTVLLVEYQKAKELIISTFLMNTKRIWRKRYKQTIRADMALFLVTDTFKHQHSQSLKSLQYKSNQLLDQNKPIDNLVYPSYHQRESTRQLKSSRLLLFRKHIKPPLVVY